MDVSEYEIEQAEKLRAQGHFDQSLQMVMAMLDRATKEDVRMRLLFDLLYCTGQIGRDDLTNIALKELASLSDPKGSRVIADLILANGAIDKGDPERALSMINRNLESDVLLRPEFLSDRFDNLAYKGKALRFLSRWREALVSLKAARGMFPKEEEIIDQDTRLHVQRMISEIMRNEIHCYVGLEDFERAYAISQELWQRENGEEKTLALHYMAVSKIGLGHLREALVLLTRLEQSLPSRLIDEQAVRREIQDCMEALAVGSAGS